MSRITDTATVTLNVNGAQAKQMMSELEQKISDTRKKISDLKADMADPKEIQKARKELKSYEKQLDDIKSATEGVENALNNLDSATPRQLEKALRTLNKQLKDMTPGSETWDSHIERIKELKERISELKEETTVQQSLWQRFMDWSTGAWPALDLLGQWGNGFMDLARSAVDAFASMDQEMANVRKFTGMTAEQVEDLNEEFKKMDTRTSREDLNKLAQEAGRLGKTSKEDVLGFVRAADKINVALDDLGDGATLTLSKLTGIFGDEKVYGTEQSLLKVGSVINELSQNCSASAPYLAEFASRMGGVGAQAGMTIDQIMGFAAVLDSNEQQVEASATALSQVIVRMMQDPAKYAKVAGLEVQSFSKMLKEDANGALIMFLETLQKAGGMDVLSPMFKDMGETGSRAISALSTLATHIEEVKAQQEAANVAFEEGISIDNEFAVQNNTVQAGLDKCKKAAQEIRVELGQNLQPVVSHLLSSTSAVMQALLTTINFLSEHKFAVMAITMAIANYTITLNFSTIATKAAAIATKAWNVITLASSKILPAFRLGIVAVANAVQYFTNGLQVNYAMQQRWRVAMSAMKMTSWIGLLTAAVSALLIFTHRIAENANKMREAREQMRRYRESIRDISATSQDYYAKEISSLKYLYEAAIDESKSKEERINAAQKLINLYPDEFKNMTAEQTMLGKAKTAYDNLTESIILNAKAKAAADKVMENEKKILEYEEDLNKNRKAYKEADSEIYKKEERNRLKNSQASGTASSLTGAIAMQSGATQGVYSNESTAKERKRRKEAGAGIDSAKRNINELKQANNELTSRFKNNKAFQEQMSIGAIESPEEKINPTGYTSKVQAEKEAKKAEAAARAAAVKAKKEFKEQLDQIKAARDKEQTEIMALRMTGEINYLEYNKRKLNADQKYYDDSIALYKKWGIQEDDECQALARKREEFLSKANEQRLALTEETIQRVAQAKERDLKARYDSKSSHTLAEELRLEEEILKIRYNALKDQQDLYKQTDKEYEDYQRQIDELFLKDYQSKQKKILEKINGFRAQFDHQSIHVKYDMERAALEELYKRKKIEEEEYRKWLKKLNEQEAEDEKKDKEDLPGMRNPQNPGTNAESARKNFNDRKKELDEALSEGRINEAEYRIVFHRIGIELRKSLISPLKECKSEWVSLVFTMIDSWADFADALKDPDGNPLVALGSAIEATAAIATSVMSMVTEFQKAEYEIQAAEVKKRYDAEIDAAQGNSYRLRKLEKDREKELANLKSEQSKKQFAMQVVQTVAQTATNALNAYGSAAAIPVAVSYKHIRAHETLM
ncbi:MAG: phage tail tape measure protein, partial [Muribaculaceae bacterium]|nr:phage tail tape measure protein [Muribaculaceae bacterium]